MRRLNLPRAKQSNHNHLKFLNISQDDIDDSDEIDSVDDETEDDSDDEDEDYEFEGENGNVLNRSVDGDDSSNGFII